MVYNPGGGAQEGPVGTGWVITWNLNTAGCITTRDLALNSVVAVPVSTVKPVFKTT